MVIDRAALRDMACVYGDDLFERESRFQERLCNMVDADDYFLYKEVTMMEKIVLRVEGMSCGHCEIAVQDAVRKLTGVKKVKASRRKKEVVVEYDTARVTKDQIVKGITGSGYSVVL